MLAGNETYDEIDTTKTVVKIESKLKEVYDLLFSAGYSGGSIGQIELSAGTKDMLVRTAGLLSEYTRFDIA